MSPNSCHFCASPRVAWRYRTPALSQKDWLACEPCRQAIDGLDRPELVKRVRAAEPPSGLPADYASRYVGRRLQAVDAFWEASLGRRPLPFAGELGVRRPRRPRLSGKRPRPPRNKPARLETHRHGHSG